MLYVCVNETAGGGTVHRNIILDALSALVKRKGCGK